jgi:hypothetical protein
MILLVAIQVKELEKQGDIIDVTDDVVDAEFETMESEIYDDFVNIDFEKDQPQVEPQGEVDE